MKKVLLVLSLAVVAMLAVPFAASAAEVDLGGRGALFARGSGVAVLDGRLCFDGTAREAVLIVTDRGGDARVNVYGYGKKIELNENTVEYAGFAGRARICGKDVTIRLAGASMRFVAAGTGTAALRGHGTYRTIGA